MTALTVISALVTALCLGYHLGRHACSTPPTWRQRTSRAALGKRAVSLVLLMTARRIQRNLAAQLGRRATVGFWAQKVIEPLQLPRSGPPRRRFRWISTD
jgi:uncharacterized protein (DUF2236 family)